MKKIISFLLCVAMLCSLMVVAANADSAPALSIADATATANSVVELDMNVVNNPGLASVCFFITDNDGLHPTYDATSSGALPSLTKNTDATSPIDGNHYDALYLFTGDSDSFATTFGTLSITIPEDATPGAYTFTVVEIQGSNAAGADVDVANTEFTINVVDKVITGINVSIDAGLAIGVHVIASNINSVSLTAVDVDGLEFKTVTDYEEDEESGDYIFYLNVNPWAMDKDFVVDFTENFDITGEGDDEALNTKNLPATAKTIGILSYCNALLAGEPSDELVQLIADLLAFGQASQTYKGVAVMALPKGLTPTVGEWFDGEENPTDFGAYCSENFPESIAKNNATAAKKFKFVDATINFGSKFSVTFRTANNGTTTANTSARIVVEGGTYTLDGWNYTYAFNPTQYGGVDFVLYATSTINNTNKAYTNTYGPATYAAYLYDNGAEGSAEIIDLLEAFYLYGVSAEAYVGSLGE